MNAATKILWGEGLFLRPQHFQRQDAYHEWRSTEAARAAHPYAWGVRHMVIDHDALARGLLRLDALSVVFRDGEIVVAPEQDPLPDALDLRTLPPGESGTLVHLAIAPAPRARTAEPSGEAGGMTARYLHRSLSLDDWYTEASTADVVTLQRLTRLIPDGSPMAGVESLPLVRVRRGVADAIELDPRHLPPCVGIAAAPPLLRRLRNIVETLQAKVEMLRRLHPPTPSGRLEYRSGDAASFWLLHGCQAAAAAQSHLQANPWLHPERLHERWLELAGALLTFSPRWSLSDLPAYRHDDPGPGFARLETLLRELLETVVSTRCVTIVLELDRPSFHHGRLDDERIDAATSFVLGVQAALPLAELIDVVPRRFKVAAPDDVERLVTTAQGGITLQPAPQVPPPVPARAGVAYFTFVTRGPLHERLLRSRALTIYVPAGFDDVRLELFAVLP